MPVDPQFDKPWTRKHDLPGTPYLPHVPKTVYPTSLEELIDICKNRAPQERLKAAGSHWALSDAAVSDHTFIETHDPDDIHPDMGRTLHEVVPGCLTDQVLEQMAHATFAYFTVVHVEAGKRIYQLYAELDQVDDLSDRRTLAGHIHHTSGNAAFQGPWAFETLGNAGGQTIVGALTTGTHGSDFSLPPIADLVAAIHLVADGGKHYWIEPTTGRFFEPQMTEDAKLIEVYGADKYGGRENFEIIRNWDVFRALLVSVGRFGIIYSVVLRAVPQFSLHEERRLRTWQDVKGKIKDLHLDLYKVSNDPNTSSRGLQIAVCLTPHDNFTKNLVGVTKRWASMVPPNAGRSYRVGRIEAEFPGHPGEYRFQFAGKSFPYDHERDPDKPGHANLSFQEIACADPKIARGALEAVIHELEELIESEGRVVGATIAAVAAASAVGAGILLMLAAFLAWVVLLKLLIEQISGDDRLAQQVDSVRKTLLDAPGANPVQKAAGLFVWQCFAYALFKSQQNPIDFDAISYAVLDRKNYLQRNCEVNVDSIEVFFDATDDRLVAFVDALIAFEIQQEFQGRAFMGYASLRFTGQTEAFIGMERYPVTCAIEVACLKDVKGSQELIDYAVRLARSPSLNGILHWGQRNDCDRADIEHRFGDTPTRPGGDLQKWRHALSLITDNGRLDGFSSAFTRHTGLEVVQPKINYFNINRTTARIGERITIHWDCTSNPPGTSIRLELDVPNLDLEILDGLTFKGNHEFWVHEAGPHHATIYATFLGRSASRFDSVTVSQ